MPEATPTTETLTAALKAEAHRLGFALVGVAPAVTPGGLHHFLQWLDAGYAGEMLYLSRREEAYQHPRSVLGGVRSIVMLGMNYQSASPAPHDVPARVSRYAWGAGDYHDLLRDRLRQLSACLEQLQPGCLTRGIVDTAPLLERDFARRAGLGWFGKNTLLINKQQGSWFFLAALLVDVELCYDDEHSASHCGTCTRCLEACPTDAFVEPYVLDARKCISYLTIELRGPIPRELRAPVGDWLFGCDVCQEVCPWNHKAPLSGEDVFQPRAEIAACDPIELLSLSEEAFRARFRHSPLGRPKRGGLLRNAAIVLGNRREPRAIPALIRALDDAESLVRGAAAWALGEYPPGDDIQQALVRRAAVETDLQVQEELRGSLQGGSVFKPEISGYAGDPLI